MQWICEERISFMKNGKKKDADTLNQKLKFQGHKLRKDELENIPLAGHTEVKRDSKKHQVNYLMRLCKYIKEEWLGKIPKIQYLLIATKGKEVAENDYHPNHERTGYLAYAYHIRSSLLTHILLKKFSYEIMF